MIISQLKWSQCELNCIIDNLVMKNIIRNYIKAENKIQTKLGEISNLEIIGEGGNALVYKGLIYGNPIAIKLLANSNPKKLTRFKSEFYNMSTLPPNEYIATTITYDEIEIGTNIIPTILMIKYDSSLQRKKAPTKSDIDALFDFLIGSLKFIHNHGIIHRDLKPENILVDGTKYKLTDFGIAHYNPEMFKLKADTKKGERLANYHFAAPEQSTKDNTPKTTMDIYALGQLCQWYATGSVHKGTNRESITKYIPESEVLDQVIDKCIANNPNDRFQDIEEIEKYIEEYTSFTKNPFVYLDLFHDVLAETFPKFTDQGIFVDDKKTINNFFINLSKRDFEGRLEWSDGRGNNHFDKFIKSNEDIWLMGSNKVWYELNIQSMFVYFDGSLYRDMVLINTNAMPHFDIYKSKTDYQEAGLVNDKDYITRNELDNGYAVINGDTVNLSEHNVSIRVRHTTPYSFFFATCYSSVILSESDKLVENFIKNHNPTNQIDENDIRLFAFEIGKNKHPKISKYL